MSCRTLLLAILVLSASPAASAQSVIFDDGVSHQPHQPITAHDFTIARLKYIMSSSALPATMHIALLERMGDSVAIELGTILKTRGPLTTVEQRNVLDMLRIAFNRPEAIMNARDRAPIASLVLLQELSSAVQDPQVQQKLAATRQSLLSVTAR
jgi:hypothetical protein